MNPRKLISFDWAIKKILRSKANFGILEGFLSELLFTDITILEVLESESNQEMGFDKYNRVDIKVADADQRIILIEVQYSRELDY
ncbi:PD-(D/E)XK nuclease family transposase, partial [Candidatus Venteria ishoeyi]|uniref:PD-(D/E)XK nuclease family transposase n=2 Tax=Candidatus Venteria ishoeyi TaxID=1899563 RepID=UPI000B08464F